MQSSLSSEPEVDPPELPKKRSSGGLAFWRRVRPTGSTGSGGGAGSGSGRARERAEEPNGLGVDLSEVDSLMTKIAEQQVGLP